MLSEAAFNHDMGKDLDGRVIHVQSLRYKDRWLKSSYHNAGKWIAVYELAERDTYYTQWSQFTVSKATKYLSKDGCCFRYIFKLS